MSLVHVGSRSLVCRRDFLRLSALTAVIATASSVEPQALAAEPGDGLIDVHAHMVPPFYREAAVAAGLTYPDGLQMTYPDWSPTAALQLMDKLNIRTAILSVSSPGVHFGDDRAARALARQVNEYAADLKAGSPDRFGFFAALPLPDFDGAQGEAVHALDVLHADGVVLLSNHAGQYPGDPQFEPLLAELNQRDAVAFVHPTAPSLACCSYGHLNLPAPVLEFMFETTRMANNLILSGAVERFPRIRFIIPHAGAALPALADRMTSAPAFVQGLDLTPDQVFAGLRSFYYDLAGSPVPRLLPVLRTIADPSRIVFGSDYPWTPDFAAEQRKSLLDQALSEEPQLKRAAYQENALQLFPLLVAM